MANNVTTRQAARNALDAYKAAPGMVKDDELALVDLVADLMFLADSLDLSGEWVVDEASGHYRADIAEGMTDEYPRLTVVRP